MFWVTMAAGAGHRGRGIEGRVLVEEAERLEPERDDVDWHDRPVLSPRDVVNAEDIPEHHVGADQRRIFGNPDAVATYRTNGDPVLDSRGVHYMENQANTNKTMDAYLVYAKELNGFIKKFDVQGGYSYQNFVIDGIKDNFRYNDATGIREPSIDEANLNNRYYNPLNLQAFFGRANIDFAGKY